MRLSKKILMLMLCPAMLGVRLYAINNVESIKSDTAYLWAEGLGYTVEEAGDQALTLLVNGISVNVSNVSQIRYGEGGERGSMDDNYSGEINTSAQLTLRNTSQIVLSNEPDARVFVYVKRSDIAKIFSERAKRAVYMVEEAERALKDGKMDYALKSYYWAYALVRSLQYPGEAKYKDARGEHRLMEWLPLRLKDVLGGIKVEKVGEDGNDVKIAIMYGGEPVQSMDYAFYDGANWSALYVANNGVGIMEMRPGAAKDDMRIRCEYQYKYEVHLDAEIESVMKIMNDRPLKESYISVNQEASQAVVLPETYAMGSEEDASVESKSVFAPDDEQLAVCEKAIQQLLAAIRTKNYDAAAGLFTEEGYEVYEQLLKYGQAKIVSAEKLTYTSYNEYTQCRGVMAHFSFKTNNKKFIEELAITFDENKMISNISFGLGEKAKEDILGKDAWAEYARMILINFLEEYKTAYALKRIDYIESVFDENAVIRTGVMFSKPRINEQNKYLNNKYVKYTEQDKGTYIKRLKANFARNEYINIRFANNDIVKLGGMGGEVYGIQIKQDYYSTTYGDTGYLFLMVDLNDPEHPVIKVRTWQPERDPNFGVIGAQHF